MSGLNVAVAHLRFEKHPGFSKGPRLDPYLTFSGQGQFEEAGCLVFSQQSQTNLTKLGVASLFFVEL